MANTSNFGWETPDDTDLVKDGALAIRTLGSAIDTSLVDLKGGTTGQVLAKASNTDMDFTWTSDQVGIPASTVDAKGDLIAGTADNTVSRLAAGTNEHRLVADSGQTTGLKYVADTTNYAIAAKGDLLAGTAADTVAALSVGTNGHVLTADSSTATGLKWAAAPSGGKVLQVVMGTTATPVSSATNTYIDTGLSVTITPSSTASKVLVLVAQNGCVKSAGNAITAFGMRLMRGATEIQAISLGSHYTNTAIVLSAGSISTAYLDSPSTTSAITYKTQFQSVNNTSNVNVQSNSETSTIVVLEIGA